MLGLGIKGKFHQTLSKIQMYFKNLFRPRLISLSSDERVAVVFSEPHDMPLGDRLVLYGLIRGFQPESYLEIGVRWGGSARIVVNAMESNGHGSAVGLDPDISNFRPKKSELHDRYTLSKGYSPDDTCRAATILSKPLDFVFIDAVHTYSAVKEDLQGILPYLAPSAHVLFHDAFHQGINQVIDEFLIANDNFTDLGIISKNATVSLPVSYSGLRLIRKGPVVFKDALSVAHSRAGLDEPIMDPKNWDYDPYANRIGNPLGRPDK